jgi:hypothetical protein
MQQFAGHPGGVLLATLLTGAIRAAWHLPLILYGHVMWNELAYSLTLQFIIVWLYMRSNRSLPVVMMFHLASNVGYAVIAPLFSGADLIQFRSLFSGLAWLIAVPLLAQSLVASRRAWKGAR